MGCALCEQAEGLCTTHQLAANRERFHTTLSGVPYPDELAAGWAALARSDRHRFMQLIHALFDERLAPPEDAERARLELEAQRQAWRDHHEWVRRRRAS